MTVLMTGFPGFLGSALLPRILGGTDEIAVCLVQRKFAHLAQRRAEALATADPTLSGRIRIVTGDITKSEAGLEDPVTVAADVTEIWHLAAVYDLAVPRDVGLRVNVEGTRRMLELAGRCPGLTRFHYFSTCYVSGRYAGPFAEDDLEVGAPFNNAYEETKHLAEAEVRARMADGLPATIYRPAIVLGDSHTGETQKFDGLYFVIQWLLRQPHVAVLPVVGDPSATRVNVVPSDFVVDATAYLSRLPESVGRTYQLADPHPLTVDEMIDVLAEVTGRRLLRVRLPKSAAKAAIGHVPGVDAVLRIPATAVDYFVHPTHYLTDHTRAGLEGSGIECPPFADYAPRLVEFMREHPDVPRDALA